MNNEKKVAFQERRIAELEMKVHDLEAENKIMVQELEYDKKLLASKDTTIAKLQTLTDEIQAKYLSSVSDIRMLQNDLRKAIATAKCNKEEYSRKVVSLIKRIKQNNNS